MHSDNTLLANARQLAKDWSIDDKSVVYSLSPLSHNLGFGAQVMALAMGGELVINDLPRGASLADRILETDTSFLVGVPPNAIDLLAEMRTARADRARPADRLPHFRLGGAERSGRRPDRAGHPAAERLRHDRELLAPVHAAERRPELIIETSGKTCPGYELRIFKADDPDTEAAPGEVGQIGGRGASLMLGYFDDQAATEDAFNNERLVHDRRSRHARRERLSAHRRPQARTSSSAAATTSIRRRSRNWRRGIRRCSAPPRCR